MSVFGARIAAAYQMLDNEFADSFSYKPMREVINAMPEPDPSRTAGCSARPSCCSRGPSWAPAGALDAMHERASVEPTLSFMARGLLTNVRRFDRFTLTSSRHNPDRTGTRTYEVGDGPWPTGFGRYQVTLVEIAGADVSAAPAEATAPW